MKNLGALVVLLALSGCAGSTTPTPAELARDPGRYDDRQITTCGQVVLGGAKCSLVTPAGEVWLSSASETCAAPAAVVVYAEVAGRFSVIEASKDLVIRKATIKPLVGGCPQHAS